MYTIHEDGSSGGISGQFENWLWLSRGSQPIAKVAQYVLINIRFYCNH